MSPSPSPRPSSPPPPPPRPAGPAQPPRPVGPKLPALRLAFAMVAVGLIGLTVHYWAPVLLLAALPTREWRLVALTPDLASLALKPPVRLRRDPRWPGLLRGGPG